MNDNTEVRNYLLNITMLHCLSHVKTYIINSANKYYVACYEVLRNVDQDPTIQPRARATSLFATQLDVYSKNS
jgi:hypothetical protein